MKVLHVIPSVSPVHGGPSRAIANIECALARRGIAVTTVTTNDDGDDRVLPVKCGVLTRTTHAARWYFPRNFASYRVSVGLAQWLKRHLAEFDVVHAHALFSFAPVAAAMFARRMRVPYVLRPLGVLNRYGMAQHHPRVKRASLSMIERPLIEAASAIHFTSQAERVEAEHLRLNCRSIVIPLGIDTEQCIQSLPCDPQEPRGPGSRLLFLSRIDPKKNLEGLLHAISLLRERYPALTLDVAGIGDDLYVSNLKSLANELHISDRISWHGYVQGQRKAQLLRNATAFVLPSFSENFGIAVVEALAAGLPCVVSHEVAVQEQIALVGAGVVTGTSSEEIASGIERFLLNRVGYFAMRTAARRLALQEFSITVMGEKLNGLYSSIAPGPK